MWLSHSPPSESLCLGAHLIGLVNEQVKTFPSIQHRINIFHHDIFGPGELGLCNLFSDGKMDD